MKKIFFLFSYLCAAWVWAQAESPFVVEIGAYESPVSLDYFKKMSNVYETIDVNFIYRYQIDAATKSEGEAILKDAKNAGFRYSRLIDTEYARNCCNNQCDYIPPRRTNAKYPSQKTSKDPDLYSASGRNAAGKKSEPHSDKTAKNEPKTGKNPQLADGQPAPNGQKSNPNSEKIANSDPQTDKPNGGDSKPKRGRKYTEKPQNEPADAPQQGDSKPKKRQIYNKETGRMEDI